MNDSFYCKMMKSLQESKKLETSNYPLECAKKKFKDEIVSTNGSKEVRDEIISYLVNEHGLPLSIAELHSKYAIEDILGTTLEESKEIKTESTISDIDETEKDELEEPVDGSVDDVVAVVDPDLSSDDYEKVIQKAEETIEETPEGEQPSDSQYVGQNIYTCPICGNAFFIDVELDEGDACPVCSEVPEAFIYNGKVDNGLTDEDEELMDDMADEVTDEEPINPEDIGDEYNEEGSEEDLGPTDLESEEEKEDRNRHESLKRKTEGLADELRSTSNKTSGKDAKSKYEEVFKSEGLKDYIKILEYKIPIICKREAEKGNYSAKFNLGASVWESWQDGKCPEIYDIEVACAEAALYGKAYNDDDLDFYEEHEEEIERFIQSHDDAAMLIEEFEKWAEKQGFKVNQSGDDYILSWE